MSIYGCYNKPRPTASARYRARDGYKDGRARYVWITNTMTKPCQYTKDTADAQCNGCKHQEMQP